MREHRHDNDMIIGVLLAVALAVAITLLLLDLGWQPDWGGGVDQRLDALEQEVGER